MQKTVCMFLKCGCALKWLYALMEYASICNDKWICFCEWTMFKCVLKVCVFVWFVFILLVKECIWKLFSETVYVFGMIPIYVCVWYCLFFWYWALFILTTKRWMKLPFRNFMPSYFFFLTLSLNHCSNDFTH